MFDFALTLAFPSNAQFGRKKYLRPFSAPSSVNERPIKTTINTNGKVAVKYLTLADDLIDFQIAK